MSKSKGEFLTVSLLEERGFDPLVYRFFCLGSHYRKNLVFSWENLENAKNSFDKLVARIASLNAKGEEIDNSSFEIGKARFVEALDNDLNTSLALTALYDVFKLKTGDDTKLALIADFDRVLGLDLIAKAQAKRTSADAQSEGSVSPELKAYIEERIAARKAAKAARDFKLADEIRAELLAKGITLVDKREGTEYIVSKD